MNVKPGACLSPKALRRLWTGRKSLKDAFLIYTDKYICNFHCFEKTPKDANLGKILPSLPRDPYGEYTHQIPKKS